MFDRIDSAGDPRVADYRGVSEPALLRSRNLFVAEGRIVVTRLIEDRRWILRSVLVSDAARRIEPTLAAVAARVPIFVCEAADFLGITGHDIHRGCLALVERPSALPLETVLADARLAVVLEGVANADNVGGVFRNAAAFGVDGVMLGPTSCDRFTEKRFGHRWRRPCGYRSAQSRRWPARCGWVVRASGFTLVELRRAEPLEELRSLPGVA